MTHSNQQSNSTELDKLFYRELRGKTLTEEQAYILDWAEKRLKPAILANYISRKDVEEAIGKDEPDRTVQTIGDGARIVEINPRNTLRWEIRTKLNLDTKDKGE